MAAGIFHETVSAGSEGKEDSAVDWAYIEKVLPLYGKAAWLTLRTGTAGILLAALVGLLCAAALHWRVPVLRRITTAYVELSRNTPLLVQLFFIYYGLPKIGIKTDPEACGVIGLAFLGGGYMAEAFRSGRLGVMDYYNMMNVQSDTKMRESIAGSAQGAPAPAPDQHK